MRALNLCKASQVISNNNPAPFGAPEPLADFPASRPESQKEHSPDPLLAPTPDPWDLKMGELYRP